MYITNHVLQTKKLLNNEIDDFYFKVLLTLK
jgi:hypothetical protein